MISRAHRQRRIFLSASVPLPSRNRIYFETADVIAIRDAVRALTMVILEQNAQLVFGGHPAITPMIRLQVAENGLPVGDHVVMFQSRYFERWFPKDNAAFERIELVDAVPGDKAASLAAMRKAMLAGSFVASIFIGGMEGVEDEYKLFKETHPRRPAFPVASTGAASKRLFEAEPILQERYPQLRNEISYLTLMRELLTVK